jgi:hypothetical protein
VEKITRRFFFKWKDDDTPVDSVIEQTMNFEMGKNSTKWSKDTVEKSYAKMLIASSEDGKKSIGINLYRPSGAPYGFWDVAQEYFQDEKEAKRWAAKRMGIAQKNIIIKNSREISGQCLNDFSYPSKMNIDFDIEKIQNSTCNGENDS